MSSKERRVRNIEKLDLIKPIIYYPMDYRWFENKLEWVLFDPKKQQMFLFSEDPPIHKPYFFMRRKLTKDELKEFDSPPKITITSKIHPLERKDLRLYKYTTGNVREVGSKSPKPEFSKPMKKMTDEEIDREIEEMKLFTFAYENYIEYHTRKEIDLKVVFGMPYKIRNGKLIPVFTVDYRKDPVYRKMRHHPQEFLDYFIRFFTEPFPNIKHRSWDIEVGNRANIMPDPLKSSEPIISSSFTDSDTAHTTILYLSRYVRKELAGVTPEREILTSFIKAKRSGTVEMIPFDTEEELLLKMKDMLEDPKHPMIVTYNGDKFDFPYSIGRFDLYGIQHSFSFKKMKTEGGKKTLRATIGGSKAVGEKYILKAHMDLYQYFVRKYIKAYAYKNAYPNVKLDTVSEVLLGEKKLGHEGRSVAELPIPELILYNVQDTRLTTKLMKREGKKKKKKGEKGGEGEILPTIILLMRIGLQSFDDCHRTEVSPKIANLFFSLLHNRNWLVPQKLELRKTGKFSTKATIKGKKYQGAYVPDPVFGIHFNIRLLDFASLYPTIIKEKNISFETVNCPHSECRSNIVPSTANEETGYTGHWICTKEKGILAQFLGFIRDIRVNHYKREGKTNPVAAIIEQVLKVFMNATYGVFAAIFFALFSPALAECVAAYSRHSFLRLYHYAIDELELEVVLGDTDSIYVKDLTDEKMELLFKFALEELDLELELEDEFRLVLASSRKKNYWCVDEEGKEKIKGLMIKKSNTPKIVKDCSQEVRTVLINELLSMEDLEGVRKKISQIIVKYMTRIWLKKGDLGDYAFWVRIKSPLSSYTKTTPQHVKAAKKEARQIISEMPKGIGITAEQIIEPGWIQGYIKGLDSQNKETVIPLTMATNKQINPEKYHQALNTALIQLVDPLGINPADLIPDDPRQKGLMDYFG